MVVDRWDSQLYCPQVRELEKQLGQRQNKTAASSSSELPVNPDPRKLTAQEKNLLRIRSLEKDKQESWEVRRPSHGLQHTAGGDHSTYRDVAIHPYRHRLPLVSQA